MARPIRETPTLRGKDADRVSRILEENRAKKVPAKDYARAMDIYHKVMDKAGLPR
jgi:hypothetical protein